MSSATPVGVTAVRLLAAKPDADGLIHLTTSERRAEQIGRFLSTAVPEAEVVVFPPWDSLPFDRAAPSREAMGRRMAALRAFAAPRDRPLIVVTSPEAALQRVPPRAAVSSFEVRSGEPLDIEALREFCARGGYVEDDRVDEVGEIAVRGGVIDIFPAGATRPFRIEVCEGRVAALRAYDALSQRTEAEIDRLIVDQVSEWPADEESDAGACRVLTAAHGKLESLFDQLPEARLLEDPQSGERRKTFLVQAAEARAERVRAESEAAAPKVGDLYLTAAAWAAAVKGRSVGTDQTPVEALPSFATAERPQRAFAGFVAAQNKAERLILLVAPDEGDLAVLTRQATRALGAKPATATSLAEVMAAEAGVWTLNAALDDGFVLAEPPLTVVTARDLLGSRARSGEAGSTAAPWAAELPDFRLGDLVIHEDHGVGVLRGVEAVEADGETREAIRLEYAKDAVLLVPVEEAGRLWRYGSEEGAVALDHLNTDGWIKRRAGVQREIDETAQAMLALAAEREATAAPKLVPPTQPYERFVARFPYATTPDQHGAIEAVLTDLASGRPMDRLVVGDVGFGKTEVALRAAAAVALAGKQVAVVAPTTVLGRQHLNTFTRRFADLGVEVAHLSRLVTAKAAAQVRAGLADGTVRVVVGTHALAAEAVSFADLGLLVIDEEQRFGAAHKERLRGLGEGVHVLTLTATPIPRTLQTALVGLQDLSTIATAPARRRAIRTFSQPFDAATVKTALTRERRRGGQSFVVVPRVEDIQPTADLLGQLAPQLQLKIAHGKMPAKESDDALVAFADGEGDVLLATSIIESGLDVPRANTMVVLRADLFGLAQLHQLRGRVGRGRAQGFCWLTTEPDTPLPEATAKRLATLQAFDRLGAGMAISAADLDLRGAGDLVGDDQAGHLKLIGVTLYQTLLAAALRKARGEDVDDLVTDIQIDAEAFLPNGYVPEPDIRVTLYSRIARAASREEVERLADEIADRFGPPPQEVQAMLAVATARVTARALRIAKIAAGPQAVALSFTPGVDPETTFAEALANSDALSWTGERLLYRRPSNDSDERLRRIDEALQLIS